MQNISKLKPFDKINIVRKCTGFTPAQKLLLLIFSTHLGEHDLCNPSLSTLMIESGMARTAVTSNIAKLQAVDVLIKKSPSRNSRSNQYAINFKLLVAQDYQCSSLGLLEWYSRTTRLVAQDYPKEQLKQIKTKEREPFAIKSQKKKSKETALKAIKEIKKSFRLQ